MIQLLFLVLFAEGVLWHVSGKVREMGREERERENAFLLFADVSGQDWLA